MRSAIYSCPSKGGKLTTLSFKACVDQPQRFTKSKRVREYLGFTPSRYKFSEIPDAGRILKCRDRAVREHLYEAAQATVKNTKK